MYKKEKDVAQLKAADTLREYIKPGDNVYTILKHVSASGMTRHVETAGTH